MLWYLLKYVGICNTRVNLWIYPRGRLFSCKGHLLIKSFLNLKQDTWELCCKMHILTCNSKARNTTMWRFQQLAILVYRKVDFKWAKPKSWKSMYSLLWSGLSQLLCKLLHCSIWAWACDSNTRFVVTLAHLLSMVTRPCDSKARFIVTTCEINIYEATYHRKWGANVYCGKCYNFITFPQNK